MTVKNWDGLSIFFVALCLHFVNPQNGHGVQTFTDLPRCVENV